ncbi:MAG: macro domain-containing protein [Pseudomonadales bacterium]|nr:macro domain-containing protein [Pseudomonadales bacterium]
MAAIELISGDITTLEADAIVCSSHKYLMRGKGLCAQVYDKAGVQLDEECLEIGGCRVGKAVVTEGYNLPAKHIIHTVTPQFSSDDIDGAGDVNLLSQCYQSVIDIALEKGFKSIIFPALGAGNNRFPQDIASQRALEVLEKYRDKFDNLTICLHTEEAQNIWKDTEQTFH